MHVHDRSQPSISHPEIAEVRSDNILKNKLGSVTSIFILSYEKLEHMGLCQ